MKTSRLHVLLICSLLLLFSLGQVPLACAQDEAGGIEGAMTPAEFRAAGLQKLTPEELAHLNAWLKGDRAKVAEKAAKKAASREHLQLSVSRVDGVIQGISTRQIVPLEDGSQWEITDRDAHYTGPAVDHPPAAVFKSFFGWKIRIAKVGEYYVIHVGQR